MINRVVLVGRLTKDIEVRKTTTGLSTATFTLACNRRFQGKDAQGPTADFINCVAWRQQADFLGSYAKKGSIVGVEGRITTRNYEGQNGRVYVTEVVCDSVQLIGSQSQGQRETYVPSQPTVQNNAYTMSDTYEDDFSNTPSLDISSDDLPFY
jgi:single-strand DNA-binding protein